MANNRRWRRIKLVSLISLAAVGLGVGVYVMRMRQIDARLTLSRSLGVKDLERGEYESAMNRLGAYLQRHPDDVEGIYLYAVARSNVEEQDGSQYSDAILHLENALNLKADFLNARRALLTIYTEIGFSTEAVGEADAILSQVPDDSIAMRAKALSLARLGRVSEAMAVATHQCEKSPTELEAQILLFQLMVRSGRNPKDLIDRAQTLTRAYPKDPRFLLLQSIAHSFAGDSVAAIDLARQASARAISDPTFITILVKQLDDTAQFPESMTVLRQFGGESVGNQVDPKLRSKLISRLWQSGQTQSALQLTRDLDGLDRNRDADCLGIRAIALDAPDKSVEQSAVLKRLAGRRHDRLASAWTTILTSLYQDTATDHERLLACRAALQKFPDHPYFNWFAGEVSERLGDDETAAFYFRAAANSARAWSVPLVRAALAFSRMGNSSQAVAAAQAARLRDADRIEPLIVIAQMWAINPASKDPRAAQEILTAIREIHSKEPNNQETLDVEVRALCVVGQRESAIDHVRGLLQLKSPIPEQVLLRLAGVSDELNLDLDGVCLKLSEAIHGMTPGLASARANSAFRTGRKDEAIRVFEQAVNRAGPKNQMAWRVAFADFLDQVADMRAKEIWAALGNDYSHDVRLQWRVFDSPSLRMDYRLRKIALDRIHNEIGDRSSRLRLAQAELLLRDNPNANSLTAASAILTDLVHDNGDFMTPRLMLAECLEKLGEISGAISQLSAIVNAHPESADTSLELVRLLEKRSDFERAEPLLSQMLKDPRTTPESRLIAASIFSDHGLIERALMALGDMEANFNEPASRPIVDPDASHIESIGVRVNLLRARLYRLNNQPQRAEGIYRKLSPAGNCDTVAAISDFYASQGRKAEATAALAALDRIKAPLDTKELTLANFFRRQNQWRDAITHYTRAIEITPSNPAAWRQLAICQLSGGDVEAAVASVHRAAAAGITDPGFIDFQKGVSKASSLQSGASSLPLFVALLTGDKDERGVADNMLQILVDAGARPGKAVVADIKRLTERHPRMLFLHQAAAEKCFHLERFEDSAAIALRAVHTFPLELDPPRQATRAFLKLGNWSDAEVYAHKWRLLAIGSPLAADLALATVASRTGRAEQALKQLEPYLSAARENPKEYEDMLALYAKALVLQGRVLEASELLSPFLPVSPSWRIDWISIAEVVPDAKFAGEWLGKVAPFAKEAAPGEVISLAIAWRSLSRRIDSSLEYKEKFMQTVNLATALCTSTSDSSAQDWMLLGMLHSVVNDLESAEADYRRALHLAPGNAVIKNNLAGTIQARGEKNSDEAIKLIYQAIEIDPDVAAYYDTLASLEQIKKDYVNAADHLHKAVQLQPGEVEWQIKLAEVLLAGAQYQKARSVVKQLDDSGLANERLNSQLRARLESVRASIFSKPS